jgi:hypothetical protein
MGAENHPWTPRDVVPGTILSIDIIVMAISIQRHVTHGRLPRLRLDARLAKYDPKTAI